MKKNGFNERELRGMLKQFYDVLVSGSEIKPGMKARMEKIMKACTLYPVLQEDAEDVQVKIYTMDGLYITSTWADNGSQVLVALPMVFNQKPTEVAPIVIIPDCADISIN